MKRAKGFEERVRIPLKQRLADAVLNIPVRAIGIVIFSGPAEKKDHRLRNDLVASIFNKENLATLLVDFDMPTNSCTADLAEQERVAEELRQVSAWVKKNPLTNALPVGFFGTCAGVAAILRASLEVEQVVLVCRGGNPLNLFPDISKINAPVLLIVGEKDTTGHEYLRQAFQMISGEKELRVVSGASTFFTELGKLGEVAVLASRWFKKYFDKEKLIAKAQ